MRRHPSNPNLHLHYDAFFDGNRVQIDKGPFIYEYLHRLNETMRYALEQYSRVFAFRVDLRFPKGVMLPDSSYSNNVLDRFFESFKAKIRHNRRLAILENPKAHSTIVRYVWAREVGDLGVPHFHLVILVNRDAFTVMGNFKSHSDNMFHRLEGAWASALGVSISEICGAVHIPQNPVYYLDRGCLDGQSAFFERASYLCKSATKVFGDGQHGFGCSRG